MADASELKPVYLLTGSDRPKIEVALQRLRRHFVPESVELTTAQELPGTEVAAICNAGSLFGDARLVVVEHVDGLRGNEGRLSRGWKIADVKAVEDYLASPAPTTTLALVAEELKKDAALRKACAKAGTVLDYSVPKKSTAAWVSQQFAARGARVEPEACAALVQLVGDDLQQLASEVDKLATWAGGEPIGEPEVELLVAAVAETPSFMLTDAWGRRDTGRTLEASEAIFEREGKPRRDLAPRLAGALGNHVSRVRQCQKLGAEGVRPRDAAGRLKLHPFYAEKLFGQAQNFSEDELRDAVVRLAELDLALKGKSRLAADLELQRALVDLG
ncbi:MAG: DNA polymerase III subunit delta [Gaiellaceae bacterium MAG52_C11]|nr:DNA polymerase III subunit delta [Candidatus Gaiellasilicea maunaloa]